MINPAEYKEDLYLVTKKAYEQYPLKYRPSLIKEKFIADISQWKQRKVYAAFYKETGDLKGYLWINEYKSYVDFCCLKSDPEYEKHGINAALVYAIVTHYSGKLNNGFYICDGVRATLHETKFQDYLEKYFGFRKAYCRLHMLYRFPIGYIINLIFPMRGFIKSKGKISSKLWTVLKLEEISRNSEQYMN